MAIESFMKIYPAFIAQGGVSPNDEALAEMAGAPDICYIVGSRIWAQQGTPFPAGTVGLWSVSVDRDSAFWNTSHYPQSQNGPWTRMIAVGHLNMQPGYALLNEYKTPGPVLFRKNVDRLIVNFDCVGGFWTQPIIQIYYQPSG